MLILYKGMFHDFTSIHVLGISDIHVVFFEYPSAAG